MPLPTEFGDGAPVSEVDRIKPDNRTVVGSVDVSTTGLIAAGQGGSEGGHATVTLWDLADGSHARDIDTPSRNNADAVRWIAFSRDGAVLAAVEDRAALQLFDVDSGDHRASLPGL